jgi:hypothetical protein
MEVEVELRSGRVVGWVEYQLRHAELNDGSRLVGMADQLSRFIRVEAFVSKVADNRERGGDDEGLSWGDLSLEMLDGSGPINLGQFGNPARDDTTSSLVSIRSSEPLLAIHFPCWHDSGKETSASILVVQRRGENWERVALLDDDNRVLQHAKKTSMKIRLG